MVWTSGNGYVLAPALMTLLNQLEQAYPGTGWLTSPQTGTIGDTNHLAEGWTNSDHNPWLNNTVRALDVAANVSGVPGIVSVSDAPDCEALFDMVNAMFKAQDPRVWPDGYAIYNRRITNPNDPGGFWAQQGDPHLYHLHISVSRNPVGFNSTKPWPLPTSDSTSSGSAVKIPTTHLEGPVFELLRNAQSGAVRAAGLNFWVALEGANADETLKNIQIARSSPLCLSPVIRDVSDPGMTWWKKFYTTGRVSP